MFREEDYTDYIPYCKYVWEKNNELALGLESREEIQAIAGFYVAEIYEIGLDPINNFIENDLILIDVVNDNLKFIRRDDYSYIDDEVMIKYSKDKMLNARGGYGYKEGYDDLGYDEITDDGGMHL